MKELAELTEEFAKIISNLENQRKRTGEFLKELNSSTLALGDEILENKLIIPVKQSGLENLTIAGVDGGLVKHSLHGIDIMLIRPVAALFVYKNNKLSDVQYYPDSLPSPIPKIVFDPFSDLEFEINSNMERQVAEVNAAAEAIEKFRPEILLMHGSIVPHYTERPASNSLLFVTYQRMIDAYKKLFATAQKNNTVLAGVVEDSRGVRFCEIINKILAESKKELTPETKILLSKTKDTNLLAYTLQLGERTLIFKYSPDSKNHPVLREFTPQIFSFYFKSAEFDRPIRIDFLGNTNPTETANRISSAILSTAGHSSYGIPAVLIEADQRAKLSENDIETFYLDLINKAGNLSALFLQRREQRPF
jgi:hypothetical protein